MQIGLVSIRQMVLYRIAKMPGAEKNGSKHIRTGSQDSGWIENMRFYDIMGKRGKTVGWTARRPSGFGGKMLFVFDLDGTLY